MLTLGTDNVMVVLLQNTSLPADTLLVNYQSLSAMLAVAQEATFSNYARTNLTSSSILITHNTSGSPTSTTVSFSQQVWASAGGALNNTISKVALVYQPTSATPDSGCLILATLDYSGTTTGGAFDVTLGTLTNA